MTTVWVHLPNAVLIDEVLTSLKAHPEKWAMAQAASRDTDRDTAWSAARSAAQSATWDAVRGTIWNAVWGAAWGAARDALRSAAWVVAGDVIAALIAYNDAGQFMKLPVEQLKAMYRLDPHPMYLLLQPAAVVFTET